MLHLRGFHDFFQKTKISKFWWKFRDRNNSCNWSIRSIPTWKPRFRWADMEISISIFLKDFLKEKVPCCIQRDFMISSKSRKFRNSDENFETAITVVTDPLDQSPPENQYFGEQIWRYRYPYSLRISLRKKCYVAVKGFHDFFKKSKISKFWWKFRDRNNICNWSIRSIPTWKPIFRWADMEISRQILLTWTL